MDISNYYEVFEPVIEINFDGEVINYNQSFLTYFKLTPRKLKDGFKFINLFSEASSRVENYFKECLNSKDTQISEELNFSYENTLLTGIIKFIYAESSIFIFVNDMTVERQLYGKYKEKLEELKRTHEQVIQADKLKVIGELTAGISHEINNPLTVACGNTELIQFSLEKEDLNEAREDLLEFSSAIAESHERILTIIKNMKEFLHSKEEEDKEYVSLNDVIKQVKGYLKPSLADSEINLTLSLNTEVVGWVNKSKIQQVLINLCQNSIDVIRSHQCENKSIEILLNQDLVKNIITIDVKDNGPGVEKEAQAKIFETFYTTKDVGVGTGLGLSISKKIMEAHQGDLEYLDAKSGATFRMTLPSMEVSSFAGSDAILGNINDTDGKKILFVDNDVNILNLCHRFLEKTPYIFIGSTTANQALSTLEKMSIDLIITDINMPHMNGRAFAETIRKSGSKIPVLYLSNKDGLNIFSEDREKLDISGFVLKPFTKDELLKTLNDIKI